MNAPVPTHQNIVSVNTSSQAEVIKIGPNTWEIRLYNPEEMKAGSAGLDYSKLPDCDNPEKWQLLLQLQAAKNGLYSVIPLEIALCINCPKLAKQLGVDCMGVHIDSAPDSVGFADGEGNTPPIHASIKGYECIVKCKEVYKDCMRRTVSWTMPLTGETAITSEEACREAERKCLDNCLGK